MIEIERLQRPPAEVRFADELERLRKSDSGDRPPGGAWTRERWSVSGRSLDVRSRYRTVFCHSSRRGCSGFLSSAGPRRWSLLGKVSTSLRRPTLGTAA